MLKVSKIINQSFKSLFRDEISRFEYNKHRSYARFVVERRVHVYLRSDAWMMRKIFEISDYALIRMVNRLFQTEYEDREYIRKEWRESEVISVCMTVGCANRYEFRMRRFGGCLQICAEDKGCLFQFEDAVEQSAVQIRDPHITCFGKNRKEVYCTTLEFIGHERIILPVYDITLNDHSAWKLEENGLILFLPFLFYCFAAETEFVEERQETLKSFVLRDIVGALHISMQKGNLTVFDVQRLKQCCRQMLWRTLPGERAMQDLEFQDLLLRALDADIDRLERYHRQEMKKARNICRER